MNDVLINAFVARIQAEPKQMTIEQVPIPYQEAVREKIEGENSEQE